MEDGGRRRKRGKEEEDKGSGRRRRKEQGRKEEGQCVRSPACARPGRWRYSHYNKQDQSAAWATQVHRPEACAAKKGHIVPSPPETSLDARHGRSQLGCSMLV